MTEKLFKKKGFKVNTEFEVKGKVFIVTRCFNSSKFMLECRTDRKTLLTRANLDTCYNKILEYIR